MKNVQFFFMIILAGYCICSAEEEYSFSDTITVNIVLVDVTVTDAEGNHVANLTKKDFVVFEDNKVQQITQVDEIQNCEFQGELDQELLSDFDKIEEEPPAWMSYKERIPLVIFIDQSTGDIFDKRRAVFAAAKYIRNNLQSYDPLAVALYGEELHRPIPFTLDHQTVANALDNCRLQFRLGSPIYLPPTLYLSSIVPDDSIQMREFQKLPVYGSKKGDGILKALLTVLKSISEYPGKKVFILISAGFIPVNDSSFSPGLLVKFSHEFANSRTMLYSIDAAGLKAPTGNISKFLENEFIRLSVLDRIATATGGRREPSGNDLVSHMKRVDKEIRSYYLLSYAKRGCVPNTFRSIRVLVNKENVTVNARPGYIDKGDCSE